MSFYDQLVEVTQAQASIVAELAAEVGDAGDSWNDAFVGATLALAELAGFVADRDEAAFLRWLDTPPTYRYSVDGDVRWTLPELPHDLDAWDET